jgi:transcriptional regulator with XRE-family HTH domain
MELAETIGRHLRALRAYQGMTQLEVATRAGITPSYLSLIESGKRDVSVGTLAKLAGILGGNVDFGLYPLAGTPVMERVERPDPDHHPRLSELASERLESGKLYSTEPEGETLVTVPPSLEPAPSPYTMDDLKRDGLGSASQSTPGEWETVMAEYEASLRDDETP